MAAALWETPGVQRQAQTNSDLAVAAFAEAAAPYEGLGRSLNQTRCLSRMAGAAQVAASVVCPLSALIPDERR